MNNIEEIKKRFELLKAATLQDTILIADLAKELKERITEVMSFVMDNPKLFVTKEVWTYKSKSYTDPYCGKVTRTIKDKLKGLGISNVYLSPEDNPFIEEGALKKQIDFEKTIWISYWDNYGTREGMYVNVDNLDENDKFRKHLWRNTVEKINNLKEIGILYKTQFFIGGWGDCTTHNIETAINSDGINKLKELGWKVILPDDLLK